MKIYLTQNAWEKLTAYVDHCEFEIGGLGKVTCDGDDFYVSDVEIFKQKVTATHVDLSADTLAEFQMEKMRAKQSLVDYKFWWHSHAKMGVFWSQTDTDTMDGSREFPWLVSVVTNHKHELKGRVDIFKPVHCHIDNVTVEVMREVNQETIDQCIADIAEKVTLPSPVVSRGVGFRSAMTELLDREYTVEDDNYPLPPAKTRKLTPQEKEKESNRLSELLVDLEEQYDTLSGLPKNKKRTKEMERLTKLMDQTAWALDMLDVNETLHV